uniref:Protein quiver n=1 Tax=Plectus sambesii TaxID=2011161 RepID=A0A914VN05_9BILA
MTTVLQGQSSAGHHIYNFEVSKNRRMSAIAVVRFAFFMTLCCQAGAVICYFCEGVEDNCVGTTCVGAYCVKRAALVNGIMRTQKMCRNADLQMGFTGGSSLINPGGYSSCVPALLWQGAPGTECTCATDYCNAAPSTRHSNIYWLSLTVISSLFLARLF